MTKFGELHPDGSYTELGDIDQSVMRQCPHFIIMHPHYREDGTCRCDDPNHTEMLAWGYCWDVATERWVAPLEDDDD